MYRKSISQDELMLSIVVPTFCHENYIAMALDSILMQKTNYRFEVLVGEDKSMDSTKSILQQYESQYPHYFQVFYREKNMYSDPDSMGNTEDLLLRAKGKYVIILEGDDFWTDDCKVEKQITFLEEHPQYIAIAHNCVVVDKNGICNGENYPECKRKRYTIFDWFRRLFPGQMTTIMFRNVFLTDTLDYGILLKKLQPDDKVLSFYLLVMGKVYCLQEQMSAYRHVVDAGYSYSANWKYDFRKYELLYRELLLFAKGKRKISAYIFSSIWYVRILYEGYKMTEISKADFMRLIKTTCDGYWIIPIWFCDKLLAHVFAKK